MGGERDHAIGSDFNQVCRCIVRSLIERYEWALLQEDGLVDLVLDSVQSNAPPAKVKKLTKHHYTIALYQACRQSDNPDRRERAFYELHRYLYRAAFNRWPELAEDAAQQALLLVHEQINRCREPGAFLAFALGKLRHAFQKVRGTKRVEQSLEETSQTDIESISIPFSSRLDQQRCSQALQEAIARLPDERQRQTIRLKYFEGLSDKAIAAHLGTTAGNVRVLRHRAMARLQNDKQLKGFLEHESSG